MIDPCPSRALLPKALTLPPMIAVGSRPAASSASAIIAVVVVFPCDPTTATARFRLASSASMAPREMTGTPARAAARRSGLSGGTAVETTTRSASPT